MGLGVAALPDFVLRAHPELKALGPPLTGCDTRLTARIEDVIFEGERLLYIAAVPDLPGIPFRIYHHDPDNLDLFEVGATVAIGWNAGDLKLFKRAG